MTRRWSVARSVVQPSEDAQFAELPRGALNARDTDGFRARFCRVRLPRRDRVGDGPSATEIGGRPNEAPHDFRERVESEVRTRRDAEITQVKSKYQREIARVEKQLRKEERELELDQADLAGRKREETVGVAESVFNF